MNIHPLTRHYSALKQLPGVSDVNRLQTADGERIEVKTVDAAEAHFLDEVLADDIRGSKVQFAYEGPEIGVAPKPFYPADEILRDYGSLLNTLPGVTHLGTVTIKCGEWLPAFETAIEVVTGNKADSELVRDLLEPQISGTQLLVRTEDEKFENEAGKKSKY